ncbi:hypothetical protein Pelo_11767 [Pelomyxa schiedti]|nr:hypothetical protein Pelo_11767 [Pelomyxa schiedti]
MPAYGADVISCGICYELVSPFGAIRIMIADSCPDCTEPYAHFDLSPQAFDALMDSRTGMGSENVTYRMISCDVEGPFKLLTKSGSSQYYTAFTVVNHRVGILSLEVSQHNGTDPWETIPRQTWNEFEVSPNGDGFDKTLPLHVRVTSLTGQKITVIVNSIVGGAVVDGPSQFDQVPYGYGGSSPECCEPPNDFGILFDDDFEGPWEKWGTVGSIDNAVKYAGTSSLFLNFTGWGGVNIGSNIPATRSQFDSLQFWARMTGTFVKLLVTLKDTLNTLSSTTATLTGVTSTWQLFTVNLTEIACPDLINAVYFQNGPNDVLYWLDDIKLIISPTRPSLADCSDPVAEGIASTSNSLTSTSDSTSTSKSTSTSTSDSISNSGLSVSDSTSTSDSVSDLQSHSTSVQSSHTFSGSGSTQTSSSQGSDLNSDSVSTSVLTSTSTTTSFSSSHLSTSATTSHSSSKSNSQSTSHSTGRSASTSNSESESQSESHPGSQSQSLSHSHSNSHLHSQSQSESGSDSGSDSDSGSEELSASESDSGSESESLKSDSDTESGSAATSSEEDSTQTSTSISAASQKGAGSLILLAAVFLLV